MKIKRNKNKKTPKDYGMDFEEFNVVTYDDKKLKGWYIESSDNRAAVLICHNTNGNKEKFLIYAKFLNQFGISVYMFDFRSHGDSVYSGSRIMHKIRIDIDTVLDYIIKEKSDIPGLKIGMFGFSLGTYACIHAFKRVEVSCMVLDSGPALDLAKAFDNLYSRTINSKLPKLKFLIKYLLKIILDARNNDVKKVVEIMSSIDKPVMFIHGERDVFIRAEDTKKLFDISISNNKEYVLVDGSHHLTNYIYLKEKYVNLTVDFFNKNLYRN